MLDFNTKTITENLEINEFKLDDELKGYLDYPVKTPFICMK